MSHMMIMINDMYCTATEQSASSEAERQHLSLISISFYSLARDAEFIRGAEVAPRSTVHGYLSKYTF